jgi:hypothetical protein
MVLLNKISITHFLEMNVGTESSSPPLVVCGSRYGAEQPEAISAKEKESRLSRQRKTL